MSRNRVCFSNHCLAKNQRGSMLVMAIVIIIIVGALALAIAKMSSDSSRSIIFEVYGTRAFNAANSGAQRALNEVLGPGAPDPAQCIATALYDFSHITAFSGCIVTVDCVEKNIVETGFIHFEISSNAVCSINDFVSQRGVTVEARVRN